MAVHLDHIARSGEPLDSESMRNAQITLSRLSTFASARIYSTYLGRFFAFMREQGRDPIAADSDDIDMYLQTLRQYAPATRGTHYGVLKGYFKRAVERGKIDRSPVTIRTAPAEPKNPTPALTVKQAQSLLDGIAADFGHPDRDLTARRDYTLIGMALFLCMRAVELSDVRWKGISRTNGELMLSFMGKGRKAATIGLPQQVF
ncbi:hypothetical protein, partial [Microbacterium sp.]|uniref:tyrosine-type recombinase/integrase n=1 Tax=Microbacterium sp. TaxID=51671 RepID=UPI0031FF3773|nr:hypothetical protein [Microbacterium sp.]